MRRVPVVLQHDEADCAPAALAAVFRAHGARTTVATVRQAAGTNRSGTSVWGMRQAAQVHGFALRCFKAEDTDTVPNDLPIPWIAQVTGEQGQPHFVTVYRTTGRRLHLVDPAVGRRVQKQAEFASRWSGIALTVTPDGDPDPAATTPRRPSLLWRFARRYWGLILAILLASAAAAATGLAGVLYLKFVVDDVIPSGDTAALHRLSLAFLLLLALKLLLETGRSLLVTYASVVISRAMMTMFVRKIVDLPLSFFTNRTSGDILARFGDARLMEAAVSGLAISAILDLVVLVGGFGIMYWQNGALFAVALAGVLGLLACIAVSRGPLEEVSRRARIRDGDFSSALVEGITTMETVKTLGAQAATAGRWTDAFGKVVALQKRDGILGAAYHGAAGAAVGVSGMVVLWLGVAMVMTGELTLGSLLAFYAVVAFTMDPLSRLLQLWPEVQRVRVSLSRVEEMFDIAGEGTDLEPRHPASRLAVDGTTALTMHAVDVQYGTDRPVVRNLSLSIARGERVALVGRTGTGKSSVARLIPRLMEPSAGEVRVFGQRVDDVDLDALRAAVCLVPQETALMQGTILDNLRFGNPALEPDDAYAACVRVGLDDLLPDGPPSLGKMLAENGRNISGGQRQRLGIARALARRPSVLILDEATSNLDVQTEQLIVQAVNDSELEAVVWIAHRPTVIDACDRVITLSAATT